MKTIQCGGYAWQLNDSELWETKIDDRCHAITWKFGSIHQSKVYVYYNHLVDGKEHLHMVWEDAVPICLQYGKTRKEAMQRGIDWIKNYKENGLPTAEETFEYCFKYYSDIYPNRVSLLDHLFFTLGGGYRWLDGSIINTSPNDHIDLMHLRERDEELLKAVDVVKNIFKEMNDLRRADGKEVFENYFSEPDAHWTQDVYEFYPISEDYANICCVPDDVKPEWLALAYEAAVLLMDKSGLPKIRTQRTTIEEDRKKQDRNREIGAKIVSDLERRFPYVKQESKQVST